MKKSILFIMMALACVFTSCEKNKKVPVAPEEPSVVQVAELNPEHAIALDRQTMFSKFGTDYQWFETTVVLSEYLDKSEQFGVEEINDVFQVVSEKEDGGADTYVYIFDYTKDGTVQKEIKGFWIEDMVLNEEAIKLTFEEAYDKLMASNFPKPHSRYCVLRKQVGPVAANAQYIFGNLHTTLFVDAQTGAVTDKNPAFGGDFGKPLGEWP